MSWRKRTFLPDDGTRCKVGITAVVTIGPFHSSRFSHPQVVEAFRSGPKWTTAGMVTHYSIFHAITRESQAETKAV